MSDISIQQSMLRNGLLLAAFALLTAWVLAFTNDNTKERIAAAERANAQKALLEIVPENRHDNDLLEDTMPIPPSDWKALGLKKGGAIHIARLNGEAVAAIYPAVAPDGYGGDIKMIVGINKDQTVAGVRVLSHTETPGLGDKIDLKKSRWILSFDGKSLIQPTLEQWKVKKDGGEFDQFTGATITPRAVVMQVKNALQVFQQSNPLDTQSATSEDSNDTNNQNLNP